MENKRKFRLYIAYNVSDFDIVKKLAHDLEDWGIYITLTQSNEVKNLKGESDAGITQSDGILFLITEKSSSTEFTVGMAKTFAMVAKSSKLIFPVIYGDIPIPEFIQNYQAIIWKNNYDEVVHSITKAANDFLEGVNKSNSFKNEQSNSSSQEYDKRNYWLLKLNPNTWLIEGFKEDDHPFITTHSFGEKRPGYERYLQIKAGDHVLGFAAGDYQRIICLMEVTNPVGPNAAQGEGFEVRVERLITPRIPASNFNDLIPEILPKLNEDQKPQELLFSLSEKVYNAILLAKTEPRKTNRKLIQPYLLTEAEHENTIDQLEFKNDIESFASVIALKKVTPPLAIGLFGNWGSGKSFFMKKLQVRIDDICGKEDEYIQNVVQVKFNSWHYSDTNLWASLITEIFDSLNKYAKDKEQEPEISKLKRTLKTTSLEREVMDEKRKALEISVKTLQQDQAQKRKRLEDISGIGLLKLILRDKRINKDLAELNNENIESVVSDSRKVDQYINEVQDTGNKAFFFFKEFFNLRGWRWLLIITIAIIVAVAVPLLKNIFPSVWENFTWQIRTYAALIAAFMTNIVAVIRPYKKMINDALDRLQSVKKTIESRGHVESSQLTSEEKELTALKSSLVNIDLKIENTQEDINDILSGKRLQKFIDDRTRDENYSNALGVISRIRKDFVTLDTLLREQHSLGEKEKNELFNPENVKLKIDRVILYIDDLDRCNEEVVVKVLEAIHLLLAFKLFVVIVGVDPRWLNNALSEKYKTLFGNNASKNKPSSKKQGDNKKTDPIMKDDVEEAFLNSLSGAATSYDYLEKIFQIPFALKPINKDGRENLIKYLISEEMAIDKKEEIKTIDQGVLQTSGSPNVQTTPAPDPALKTGDKKTADATANKTAENNKQVKERLVFTKEELKYMQEISSLFGHTPRTINRYVNIYRIIKAHDSLEIVDDFSKNDFMPVMFILGIIVGYPSFAEEFIDQAKKAVNSDKFEDFINRCVLPERLKKIIKPLLADIKNLPMQSIRRNIDLISRFSFRTLLKEE